MAAEFLKDFGGVNGTRNVIQNADEVLRAFKRSDLRLVLQGHLHIFEEIKEDGFTVVTGGAVCGDWWKGPHWGIPEGFVVADVRDGQITWQYQSYGWHAVSN